jgi:hypothetical protein
MGETPVSPVFSAESFTEGGAWRTISHSIAATKHQGHDSFRQLHRIVLLKPGSSFPADNSFTLRAYE